MNSILEPELLQKCKLNLGVWRKFADSVEIHSIIQEQIGVTLKDNQLLSVNKSERGSSIRLVRNNQEYNLYYPTTDLIEVNNITNDYKENYPTYCARNFVKDNIQIISHPKWIEGNSNAIEVLENKANEIRKAVLKLDKSIKITDFQLSHIAKEICIVNTSNTKAYIYNPEFVFEIEIQKAVNGETILGSSYIYERDLDDISIEKILSDVSFPLQYDNFKNLDKGNIGEQVVFGHPISSSVLENIVYYDLMSKPIVNQKTSIKLVDNPLDSKSVNYYPFDDFGEKNKKVNLYGSIDIDDKESVNSYYHISDRNCHRDIATYPKLHPTNAMLMGKTMLKKDLYNNIEKGIYCHLIVGNHNCTGKIVEGTVFNGFEICNGKFKNPLLPFKIRFNKEDFLDKISMLGDDYQYLRPFPWWRPLVTYAPTIVTSNLKML
ncbi:metallopeptidase TldD-related protein [Clostridium sporogenes]|uniref:metallopeptidase TldD-related protein n=1 Tax=Clostridium sporogenes TaxID=1509 RepID=UPI0006B29F94|nr:metallopeptidase TldD-related protein [Clostridium sporogenes]KOY65408.1 hypothetical protein AN649_13080 [Clostridium sporogenes]MDS1006663.1 metallopeptidase TldD-related protein [Clostridium sporogenes]